MLIITLSLAGFAACVTFAVGAQIFIVPAMTGQSQAIQVLQSQVRELRSEVRNLEEQLTEATEPQAASPAEPAAAAAPAPSPAPAPAPAK
jgi:outer membrane murein-binding lipoprotein Lpp